MRRKFAIAYLSSSNRNTSAALEVLEPRDLALLLLD